MQLDIGTKTLTFYKSQVVNLKKRNNYTKREILKLMALNIALLAIYGGTDVFKLKISMF